MAALSVFVIQKWLVANIGEEYEAKKLSSGDLLVQVKSKKQSDALLKQEKLAYLDITVTFHRSLNSVQGVISEHLLMIEDEKELLENLRDQNVTSLRRITIRRKGEEKTPHIVLTFGSTRLSESELHSSGAQCARTFLTLGALPSN